MAAAATGSAATGGLELGPSLYESIGVTPIVNCRGTFTIISGSLSASGSEKGDGRSLAPLRPYGRADECGGRSGWPN